MCVLPAIVCARACDYSILTRADIAGNLWWHIRGALGDGRPSKALIMHEDRAIQESIALAMGQERIDATASAFEAEGDQLSAAKLCWIGDGLQRRGMIPREAGYDFVFRAASLLEACASDVTRDFELEVLNQAFAMDFGSDRHKAVMKRLEVVSGGTVTYESKIGEGLVSWAAGAQACGMYGGERSQW